MASSSEKADASSLLSVQPCIDKKRICFLEISSAWNFFTTYPYIRKATRKAAVVNTIHVKPVKDILLRPDEYTSRNLATEKVPNTKESNCIDISVFMLQLHRLSIFYIA